MPNILRNRIALIAKGYPEISSWSDLELKTGWESLGVVVSSGLLSGVRYDYYVIPQTMAVEIDEDSNEFQEWYHLFARFPPAESFEALHKISENLNNILRS